MTPKGRKSETTTIKISLKLKLALKKDGYMGETYEDVIWRWKGKDARNKKNLPPEKFEGRI